jgi:ribonuclease HIII
MLIKSYEHIKSVLRTENILTSEYKTIDYGVQFNITSTDGTAVLRIYENKKGLIKIDYSQIKNINYASKVQLILEGKNTILNKNNIFIEYNFGYPIIGTDESGKGDYFGPLVAAAVYVDEKSANELNLIGVKDSKTLSDNKNIELSKKIKKICKNHFIVIEISPEKYNLLYFSFKKENKNLNSLLAWGHAKAIEEL